LTSKDDGDIFETHLSLTNGRATGFNRIITASAPITEDLHTFPRAKPLATALARCGGDLVITQTEQTLTLVSGKGRFTIPCASDLFPSEADPAIAIIDDRLKDGFAALSPVIVESGKTLIENSILLKSNTMLSTNRMVVFEFFHGIDLPTVSVPKAFIEICKGIKSPFKGFGYSGNSITIHCEDGSWIKTQLMEGSWPKLEAIFERKNSPAELPTGLWEGVDAIKDFSDDGFIRFKDGQLQSHPVGTKGAVWKCQILPAPNYATKNLALVKDFTTADFNAENNTAFFYGKNIRAVVQGREDR
jgi:hypothetical protein